MHHVKNFALQNSATKITLETAAANFSAQKLYISEGYQLGLDNFRGSKRALRYEKTREK